MVKQQQNENIKSMEVVDCNVNNLDNFIKEKKIIYIRSLGNYGGE